MRKQQWRVTFRAGHGDAERFGTCFIDADTEELARKFFAQSFLRATIESIALEPADPCAGYERRP